MKRPWLVLSLIAVCGGIITYGMHYGPERAVQNGIARFRATLPPKATFEYTSARPDLLARGALLTDVVLRINHNTYRARTLRIGHVNITAEGGLHLYWLDVDEPSVESAPLTGHAQRIRLRNLILPPNYGDGLGKIDLAHTILDNGKAENLTVKAPRSGNAPWLVDAGSIVIRHYGLGQTTSFHADDASVMRSFTVPSAADARNVKVSVHTMDLMEANTASLFLKTPDPLSDSVALHALYLPHAISASLRNFRLESSKETMILDTIDISGNPHAGNIDQVMNVQGVHMHSSAFKSPVLIDGKNSTVHQTTTFTQATATFAYDTIMTVPDLATLHLTAHALLESSPLKDKKGGTTIALQDLEIAFQGDRFVKVLPDFVERRHLSDDEEKDEHQKMVDQFKGTPGTSPILSTIYDYFSTPNGRTLTVHVAPPEPLPFDQLSHFLNDPAYGMMLYSPDVMTVTVK